MPSGKAHQAWGKRRIRVNRSPIWGKRHIALLSCWRIICESTSDTAFDNMMNWHCPLRICKNFAASSPRGKHFLRDYDARFRLHDWDFCAATRNLLGKIMPS